MRPSNAMVTKCLMLHADLSKIISASQSKKEPLSTNTMKPVNQLQNLATVAMKAKPKRSSLLTLPALKMQQIVPSLIKYQNYTLTNTTKTHVHVSINLLKDMSIAMETKCSLMRVDLY